MSNNRASAQKTAQQNAQARLQCGAPARKYMQARLLRIYRRGLIKHMTPAETCFEQILKKLKLTYMPQAGFFTEDSFYIVDFYLKYPHKLVVEINGADHKEKSRSQRDRDKLLYFERCGYRVLVFSNEQVLECPQEVETALLVKIENKGSCHFCGDRK